MKETVSRIPASFAAVIGNCVVNEANECLHPFLSITHSQIHSHFPSYFPNSGPNIGSLQVVTPFTRHSTSSLQLPISRNGICLRVGAISWRWTRGSRSFCTPARWLQGKHKLSRSRICSFHTQGSPVKKNCCDKLPSDPEITNIWRQILSLFWQDIAPRL